MNQKRSTCTCSCDCSQSQLFYKRVTVNHILWTCLYSNTPKCVISSTFEPSKLFRVTLLDRDPNVYPMLNIILTQHWIYTNPNLSPTCWSILITTYLGSTQTLRQTLRNGCNCRDVIGFGADRSNYHNRPPSFHAPGVTWMQQVQCCEAVCKMADSISCFSGCLRHTITGQVLGEGVSSESKSQERKRGRSKTSRTITSVFTNNNVPHR